MAAPFSNRVTLDALRTMPAADMAALPGDQLAVLQEDIEAAVTAAKAMKERFDAALDLKYGARAATARRAAGKDTGTVRLAEDGVTVVADLPKRTSWDQAMLAGLVAEIRAAGDDPAEYVTTEFKVPERAWGAWPSAVRTAFEPARTVTAGKPTYKLICTQEK